MVSLKSDNRGLSGFSLHNSTLTETWMVVKWSSIWFTSLSTRWTLSTTAAVPTPRQGLSTATTPTWAATARKKKVEHKRSAHQMIISLLELNLDPFTIDLKVVLFKFIVKFFNPGNWMRCHDDKISQSKSRFEFLINAVLTEFLFLYLRRR